MYVLKPILALKKLLEAEKPRERANVSAFNYQIIVSYNGNMLIGRLNVNN